MNSIPQGETSHARNNKIAWFSGRKWSFLMVHERLPLTPGSLSNHDDDDNKMHILNCKNNSFARFALSFFIFEHFADVLVLSTT